MNYFSLQISLAAVLPAWVLAGYVFYRDRVEKEPWWLLALLFALGAVVYVPGYFACRGIAGGLDALFASHITYDLQGNPTYAAPWAEFLHPALVVLGTVLVQEILKWLAMFLPTFRSRQFNCLFDGVVYGVFTALGFGTAENLLYAWQGGWDALLLRSLTTLPGHLYCGVVMGCCYTLWLLYRTAKQAEKHYENLGLVQVRKPIHSGVWFITMLLLPVALHGSYALVGTFRSGVLDAVYYVCNGALFVLCMLAVRRLSAQDAYRGRYADALLDQKYPQIRDLCTDVEGELPGKPPKEADHE